jgi:hypothetical protein
MIEIVDAGSRVHGDLQSWPHRKILYLGGMIDELKGTGILPPAALGNHEVTIPQMS